MLIPKSADLVEQGGKGLHPGKVNTVVHKEDGYALSIFKSPKVGKKAARAVPLVKNCHHGPHVWRKLGCSVPGRGAAPPQFWVLLIWFEPEISHVTWVHYDATMCLACFVSSILPVLHFLQFDLCVL